MNEWMDGLMDESWMNGWVMDGWGFVQAPSFLTGTKIPDEVVNTMTFIFT